MSSPIRADAPWSIARRLASLFTLVAAVLLASAMAIVWFALARHADEEDARFLRERIGELRRELRGGGAPEKLIKPATSEAAPFLIRVENAARGVVAESPGMAALAPSAVFDGASIEHPREWRTNGKWLLLAAADESGWRVQVAQDRTEDREFMVDFTWLLGALVLGGVALSTWLARAVTRRGLRPLVKMTAAAERIHAAQLHERLASADWPAELRALAAAFDAMLRRLEGAFARLSQFSADLAHELRTPVFNLRGEAEVALSQARSADEYRDVLGSSLEELDRLSQMIDSLLFLARAESPETHIERRPLDARREIEIVVEFHEAAVEERGISISVEGHGTVAADPIMFQRAVSNLLENAVQQTSKGGSIVVRLDGTAAQTSVSVADTGPGIAPEHLPQLFDRFFRADPARHASGSGLGLAIVKSIMDLHGGSAAVQSVVGKGSTFTLRFPAGSAPA